MSRDVPSESAVIGCVFDPLQDPLGFPAALGGLDPIAARIASYGDSTAQGMADADAGNDIYGGVIGWLDAISRKSAMVMVDSAGGNFATSGQTAAWLYTNRLPDLLAADPLPDLVVNQMGTNDLNDVVAANPGDNAAAAAELYGYITDTVDDQVAAGIKPVQCTILPRALGTDTADMRATLAATNDLIRSGIEARGAILADIAPLFRGGATDADDADTTLLEDDIHPHSAGQAIIAKYIFDLTAVAERLPDTYELPASSLTPNHQLADGTTSATSWTVAATGAGVTATASKNGSDQQVIEITGGGTPGDNPKYVRLLTNVSVTDQSLDGKILRAICDLRSADLTGFWAALIQLSLSGTGISTTKRFALEITSSSILADIDGTIADITSMLLTSSHLEVPASSPGETRRLDLALYLYGSGTVTIPQFGVYETTPLS